MPARPITRWGDQPAIFVMNRMGISMAQLSLDVRIGYGSLRGALLGASYPSTHLRQSVARALGKPEWELFTQEVLTSAPPMVGRKPAGAA